MYPARFDYHTPQTLAETLALLREHGDEAKILAGGHSLVPAMKLRLAQPAHLIDVSGIVELRGVSTVDGWLEVGAFTTHWEVESSPVVHAALPYLSSVAGMIADPQVRNRGTIGGSLVHADPAADYPASVLALDAELVCFSETGQRAVPASEWFIGLMTTALEDGELLGRVRFPLLEPDCIAVYLKMPHPASRFAVVGISANLRLSADGTVLRPRIAVTGIAGVQVRAHAAEAILAGARLDDVTISAAARQTADELDIESDLFYSVEDKAHLCRVHVSRALVDIRDRHAAAKHDTSANRREG
jgi:carbon-monoxide dehydrogenase medium subunit